MNSNAAQNNAHNHAHHDHSHGIGNIRLAFFLNLGFTVFEIVGGFYTNSMAILSDAIHDLGDSFSLGLAWYLEGKATSVREDRYTYGRRRYSLLGTLINTVVLIIGSLFILSEAVPRLLNPEHSNATGMIAFAIVGVLVNGAAVLRLRRDSSFNARVVGWHLLEDVLGWIAVLVVAIVMYFRDIHILDPILSILITLYVLANVLKNLKATLSLFLQAVPEGMNLEPFEDDVRELDGVQTTHHTHVWSLDGEHQVLTMHVVVSPSAAKEDVVRIKTQVREMSQRFHPAHLTIEIDYADEDCSMNDLCLTDSHTKHTT